MEKKIKERIKELIELINYHNRLYYVENNPIITDVEFDKLYKELSELERRYPTLQQPNSPIRKVGGAPQKGFTLIEQDRPMLRNCLVATSPSPQH